MVFTEFRGFWYVFRVFCSPQSSCDETKAVEFVDSWLYSPQSCQRTLLEKSFFSFQTLLLNCAISINVSTHWLSSSLHFRITTMGARGSPMRRFVTTFSLSNLLVLFQVLCAPATWGQSYSRTPLRGPCFGIRNVRSHHQLSLFPNCHSQTIAISQFLYVIFGVAYGKDLVMNSQKIYGGSRERDGSTRWVSYQPPSSPF